MNKYAKCRTAFAVCIGLLAPCHMALAQTSALQHGLEELFLQADRSNATLQSMRSAITQADAGIASAQTQKLPEISGTASVSYLGNARIWNRHFGESTSAPMPHYGNNFALRAEQVLYAGGAIKGSIELSQQGAQMARLSAADEQQRVRFALASLYFQLHELYNQERIYAKNREQANEQITLMKNRRQQGVSLRNDVTRYELQLQQITLGETSVKDRQSIVSKQLLTALGNDSAHIAMLGEEAFNVDGIEAGSEASWQQLAATNHLGLQQSSLSVDMSRTQEKIARAARLPKFAIVAEDHLDGPVTIEVPPLNKNLNYWYVGVGVSYNFSSLYKAKKKINEARLATVHANDQLEAARQGVSDAVHAAYVNLQTARTQLQTCEKSVQLATENYDVVSNRYKNGLAIVTDLTDAANMKLDAQLALVNARINVAFSFYNLKYVTASL